MNWKIVFFLLIFFLSVSHAAPVTDLNLFLVNPPAILYKDLNFGLTWNGGDVNRAYWKIDSDANILIFDQNFYNPRFDDDFSNSTLSNRYTNTTNFSVVSSVLEGAGGSGAMYHAIRTGHINDWNISNFDVNVTMSFTGATIDFGRFYAVADASSDAGMKNSFYIELAPTGNLQVKYEKNGGGDVLIYNAAATTGSNHVYNIKRVDGNVSVFQDGVIKVSTFAFDVNFTNYAFYVSEPNVGTIKWDDVNMSYPNPNSTLVAIATPEYQTRTGFTLSGTKIIQVTLQNTDGNASTSLSLTINPDVNAPTIQRFDINGTVGFGVAGKLNYALRCTDDLSSNIDYNLFNNGATQYSNIDSNNETIFLNAKPLNTGTNQIIFKCTDQGGNTSTDTNTFSAATAFFYLVYSETGIGLTGQADYNAADINSFRVYSSALQTYIDLFATGDVNVNYSGLGDDSITFIPTYTNAGSKTSGKQYFDISAIDTNSIPVCFSKLQPFYEQLVYSTTARPVKINSQLTGCHLAMAYNNYAYADGVSISVYTIPGTYELSYRVTDSNSYTLLSLLAGDIANSHNLDIMIINKQPKPDVAVSTDILTASKFCQVADCNVLSVTYVTPQQNSSVTIQVLKGITVLTSTTVSGVDSNFVTFTWDFTTADVNADFLILKALITRADGTTETLEQLFTLRGIQGFLDPGLAIMLAFGLFFFVFTIVATRFAVGWVGIIAVLISLAILSSAPGTQMVLLSQAIFIVIGAVIFFTWKNETAKGI